MEVFNGDFVTKNLPYLPARILASSMVMHNRTILLSGGFSNDRKCLQLSLGVWKEHSNLNMPRLLHSAVATKTATFIFGGEHSKTTYEYLPKDSTVWLKGKNEIPGGFSGGCAIAVKSEQEIWLVGGLRTGKRILSFNVNNHTFQELPFQLGSLGRFGHKCTFIPNTNKIIVTGGALRYNNLFGKGIKTSTEIIDTEDGDVTMISSSMNICRAYHGMGVVTINGQDQLVVFGGRNDQGEKLNSVELYNIKTEKWENAEIKLNEPKELFGFLTIKLSDVISKL